MKRPPATVSLLMVALSLAALPATSPAQTPTTLPLSTDDPVSAPPPPPAAHKRERAISSEVAASLAAAMPKYNPPKPAPPPKPIEEQPDLRETDKPKNGIVRLPNYVVREAKPPVFRERDINTQQGLVNIARKRYVSETFKALNFSDVPLFSGLTDKQAMAMYAEDERLKNITELNDAAGMVSARDKAQGAYIKRDIQATTMRTDDYGWQKKN